MAEGDNWGYLSPLEGYGRVGDYASDYIAIPYETAVSEQKNYMQAAHAMLYAFQDNVLWDMFNTRAAILMQMRFDGLIGFPGGLVDEPGESPMQGLNRELEEEIGLDSAQYTFTHNHHINTVVHHQKKLCLHFFAMEVKMDEFIQLEKESISAPEYGVEVFGVLRPPLYTMADGVRGLPAFLTNRFAGNAREQFLLSLTKCNILTETEVTKAWNKAQTIFE